MSVRNVVDVPKFVPAEASSTRASASRPNVTVTTPPGAAVKVAIGVFVARGVNVGVEVDSGVNVDVEVGAEIEVAVEVDVEVDVEVETAVAPGVDVCVDVEVRVKVEVGVTVLDSVGKVGITVGVGVVGEMKLVSTATSSKATSKVLLAPFSPSCMFPIRAVPKLSVLLRSVTWVPSSHTCTWPAVPLINSRT